MTMKATKYVWITALATVMACGGNTADETAQKNGTTQNEPSKNVIKVTTLTLLPQKFEHYFEVNGTVKSDFDVYLSPEMNGQIKEIYVKEGDAVTKGQLLAKLNTSVIQNNINEVKTSLALAQLVYQKQEKLWKQDHIGSEIQYLEAKTKKEALEQRLKALQAQLLMSEVKAPFAGIIEKVFKKQGEVIAPGMPLFELVNIKQLYVDADVSETYLPYITLNDSVYVKFPALGDNVLLKATVQRIGNVINPGNRTFTVRVNLPVSNRMIKPNLMAYVGIRDYYNDSALVIPSKVILEDSKGNFVYKTKGNNKVDKAYVTPVFTSGEQTAVESGQLAFGDKIIINGYNQVTKGSEIKIVKQ